MELLVVIGILAALVMSAVSRAKSSTSKITDINNLKQIMVTLHVYTADNTDVITPPNWDNGGSSDPQRMHQQPAFAFQTAAKAGQ